MTSTAIPSPTTTQTTPSQTTVRRTRLLLLLAYILLFALAIGVRWLTYARYLPVLEHVDESFRFIHAYQLRPEAPLGTRYGVIEWSTGFPPLQPWIAIASQRLVERLIPFPYPPDYIGALRLFSAAMNVITVALLALTGWRIGHEVNIGWLTGLLAALPWAVAPRIVGTGNLALIDPLIFPAVAAALYFTVHAIQDDSPPAAVGALLAVIAGIYLKYVVIYALWLPFCAAAVLVYRRRWRSVKWIALMALISALTAGWLLFGHNALALDNREANKFYTDGITNMLSLSRNADNLRFTLEETLGVWLFLATLIAGAGTYVVNRQRGRTVINLRWLIVLLPYMLACLMLTSSVDILRTWDAGWFRVRYTLPMAQGLLLIWALSAGQVVICIARQPASRWIAAGFSLLLVALILIPALITHAENIRRWNQPHTLQTVWAWSDASLPNPDGKILMHGGSILHKTWNRPWGGYNGATSFEWGFTDTPWERTPQEQRETGYAYFAATDHDLRTVYARGEMRPWLSQLYPLKTLPPTGGVNQTTIIYRMIPPQQIITDAQFTNQIALVGYDLSTESITRGETLTLRPYWQALAPPNANLSLFVHLRPTNDPTPIVQYDGAPASPNRLTPTWRDPDEVIVGVDAILTIPLDIPVGDYYLALGLYDFQTGARVSLTSGNDAYLIPLPAQ